MKLGQAINIYVTILCVSITVSISGQDIHYSQIGRAPIQLNPSLTGAGVGKYRATAIHRNQWGILGLPFKTYGASFDTKVQSKSRKSLLGIGVNFSKDVAGDLNLGYSEAGLSLSSHLKVNDKNMFSIGIRTGFVQRSIDMTNARWASQFDGKDYNPTLAGGNYDFNTFSYFDLGLGLSWKYSQVSSTLSSSDEFWVQTGMALDHLTRPRQDYYVTQQARTVINARFFAVSHIGISNHNVGIRPQLLVSRQGKHYEVVVGALLRVKFTTPSVYTGYVKETALYYGLLYRYRDAIIPTIRFEHDHLSCGVSYDFNVSKLWPGTGGYGGFEISFMFDF